MASDLATFVQYLGHSHIAIKSIVTGEEGAKERHFQAIRINQAEDYITLRNGKRQLWINLQKLKPEVGKYIAFGDIESYKNVYIDLDCEKPKAMRDYAATESERSKALSQLPILRKWLESHNLRCGLELHTGNGAGMVLPIPETKAEPIFIAKLATFLRMVQAAIPCTDHAMFDPSRVIGIPGTINVKLETDDRKNQVREIVGEIPARKEDPALLSLIQSLEPDPAALKEWTAKSGERQAPPEPDKDAVDAEDILDKITGLFDYEPELKALLDGNIERFDGDRSAAEYGVCGRLVKFGFTDSEIDFIMCKLSKIGKWLEEGPHYRFEQTLRKLREAEANNRETTKAEHSDILARIKSDPRALKDPAILASLADLKINDPVEYDLLFESIKNAAIGVKVATINDLVSKFVLVNRKAADKPLETSNSIEEKARAIAEQGDPLKYLIWQAQRNHLGDIDYQKVLIASIASAASQNSNGIQPGGNGDKGSGKSDACAATYHLVPPDRRLDGSLSPMSLFYLQEMGRLKPGMILFSDDVEYEPIIPIYKRATARFQQGITHFSVSGGKDRKGIELHIPPRMVWWLTSVESVPNEQAFDRQYPISTDSSIEHKKKVTVEIAARRARKELKLAEDEGIEVAREIIRDLFDSGPFKVLIPQASESKWLKTSDFRGQEQFWDLVNALTVLRWRQRKIDSDGWLIADNKDLIEAKEIHSGHKVSHYADLTEGEAVVVGAMTDGLPKTQKDLTEALGIAQSTVSERLTSIIAKSAIITEDFQQGRKFYSINPKMQIGADYWNGLDLIKLNIDSIETYRSQEIALSGCYRYVIGLPIGIIINNSNRIPSSLSVDKQGSIEKGYPCDDCRECPLGEVYLSTHSPAKSTDNDQKEQQKPLLDADKIPKTEPIRTDNATIGTTDLPIRRMSKILSAPESDFLRAEEQHSKDVAGMYTKPKKKVVALYILADRAPYKKDEIVGINAHGEFSVLPGICRQLECGECKTAIRGDLPLCEPCNWQRKPPGRAEA